MISEKQKIKKIIETSIFYHNLNKKAEKELGLTLVQYHLLSIIKDSPGASHQQIAEAIGLSPGSLTQSLKRMTSKDFIVICHDPKDARRKIIILNTKGKIAIDKFESGLIDFLKSEEF